MRIDDSSISLNLRATVHKTALSDYIIGPKMRKKEFTFAPLITVVNACRHCIPPPPHDCIHGMMNKSLTVDLHLNNRDDNEVILHLSISKIIDKGTLTITSVMDMPDMLELRSQRGSLGHVAAFPSRRGVIGTDRGADRIRVQEKYWEKTSGKIGFSCITSYFWFGLVKIRKTVTLGVPYYVLFY